MTYSVGGKIQASDINGFLTNNTPNLNNIWSTGTGTYGYGQTAIATVAVGSKIRAVTWAGLINNINAMANHQGVSGSITAMNPLPIGGPNGNKVKYFAPIASNLTTVTNSRMNAVAQAQTTSSTVTSTASWSNAMTATFTVTFASADAIRYYFNAGGQVALNCSHPNAGNINTLINQICAAMGQTWMSSPTSGTVSLAGTAWPGIKQVNNSISYLATVNTNYGFHAWTGTPTQVLKQFVDTNNWNGYGTSTFGQINVSTSGNTLTVSLVLDEVPNGAAVASGTAATLTLRPPSIAYLTNTWGSVSAGTISISGVVTSS